MEAVGWAEELWGLPEAPGPVNQPDADIRRPIAPRDMSPFQDKAANVSRSPWQINRQLPAGEALFPG